MRRTGFLSMVCAAMLAVACEDGRLNDSGTIGTAGTENGVSRADRDFVNDLGVAGMAEVELGKMAAERAANAEVKRFAQRMVDDHSKGADKLKAVATSHNIMLPTELDDKHRDLRDRLSKLNGAEFDREYM